MRGLMVRQLMIYNLTIDVLRTVGRVSWLEGVEGNNSVGM